MVPFYVKKRRFGNTSHLSEQHLTLGKPETFLKGSTCPNNIPFLMACSFKTTLDMISTIGSYLVSHTANL
jgi:hypothetical protein